MYEDVTYDAILARMLDRVPDDLDKREGSVIYDALAPAAIELQLMYLNLDYILQCMFIDTASRDYLVRAGNERGIAPKDASAAVGVGVFNIDVPLGTRFSCDIYNYVVTEQIDTGKYYLTCETTGSAPNSITGALIPIEYVPGLTFAELDSISIPGADEEDTDTFRARLINSYAYQAFGGNQADYKNKVLGISGVGAVKIKTAWHYGLKPTDITPTDDVVEWSTSVQNDETVKSTVKQWLYNVVTVGTENRLTAGCSVVVYILDSEYGAPSKNLVSNVQNELDPVSDTGEGMGLAPIGHIVTVSAPGTQIVNVYIGYIDYADGYNWQNVKQSAENIVKQYFSDLRKSWQTQEGITVRASRIEAMLLNCTGIIDIGGVTIFPSDNGNGITLLTDAYTIPLLGEISVQGA